MNKLKVILIITLLPLLAACGGGGSMGNVLKDPDPIPNTPIVNATVRAAIADLKLASATFDTANEIVATSGSSISVEGFSVAIQVETDVSSETADLMAKIVDLDSKDGISSVEITEVFNYYSSMFNDLVVLDSSSTDGINIESSLDKVYSRLNVKGLKQSHADGWVGKGTTSIGIFDTGIHGIEVADTAFIVAPGASIIYKNGYTYNILSGMDITNHSYGSSIEEIIDIEGHEFYGWVESDVEDSWKKHFDDMDAENPNALHVLAGPNTGDCFDDYEFADICDAASVAYIYQGLDGVYIFVGAYSDELLGYNSVAVGPTTELQNAWIVADGVGIGGSEGTSFAAPKVAGAAALVMHKFPNADAALTKKILLDSADNLFDGYKDYIHGQGLLDVGAALSPVGELH